MRSGWTPGAGSTRRSGTYAGTCTGERDRRAEDEARIAAEVGTWISEQVLGPVAPALRAARPATVEVVVPAEARSQLYWPLAPAHGGGPPASLAGVTRRG